MDRLRSALDKGTIRFDPEQAKRLLRRAARKRWAERDAEGSIAAISDEMVRSIQVIGSIEEVREQLHERSDLGAQIQMLYSPPGDPKQFGATLEAMIG